MKAFRSVNSCGPPSLVSQSNSAYLNLYIYSNGIQSRWKSEDKAMRASDRGRERERKTQIRMQIPQESHRMEISAFVAVDFGSLIGILGLSGIFKSPTTKSPQLL